MLSVHAFGMSCAMNPILLPNSGLSVLLYDFTFQLSNIGVQSISLTSPLTAWSDVAVNDTPVTVPSKPNFNQISILLLCLLFQFRYEKSLHHWHKVTCDCHESKDESAWLLYDTVL